MGRNIFNDDQKPRKRNMLNGRYADGFISVILLLVVLTSVEFGSRTGFISSFVLPAPSAVAEVLFEGIRNGLFVDGIVSTLSSTVSGFSIAAVLAFAIGGTLVAFPRLENIFYPFIVAFQALPKIAIAPLAIIWLGLGSQEGHRRAWREGDG